MKKNALLLAFIFVSLGSYAQKWFPPKRKMKQRSQIVDFYSKSHITFAPLSASDLGLGMGLGYEHIMNPNGTLGFQLPIYGYAGMEYMLYSQKESYATFDPGINFYPFGQRKVTYSIGLSIPFTYGRGASYVHTPTQYTVTQFGATINNSVRFYRPTRKFGFGMRLGLGAGVYEKTYTKPYASIDKKIQFIGRFGVFFDFRL